LELWQSRKLCLRVSLEVCRQQDCKQEKRIKVTVWIKKKKRLKPDFVVIVVETIAAISVNGEYSWRVLRWMVLVALDLTDIHWWTWGDTY
jgi:hypothetical protein